ncbi:integrase, catalytic region, zinc finger, CCHC-type containing protein [Tanacetum coccineum]
MEAAVEQCSVDKKCFEIQKKELLLENDRLLELIISQDLVHTAVNTLAAITDYESEKELLSCNNLDAPALNELFVINDLKAQLQTKESLISKLRAHITTLKGKSVSDNNVSCHNSICDSSKNDSRITPAASSNKKNKTVEAHPRKVMSSSNKRNHVSMCNTNFKHAVKDTNSKFVLVRAERWNENLLAKYLLVLDIVPPKETSQTPVITPNPEVKVYRRRTKVAKYVVQIILGYLDSRCSKHMTGQRSQLINFVEKFLGTVRFGNDHIAKIMGYGDYQIGNVTISRVYYVEGLGHNLFSMGQFCDFDLEVAFWKHTCFVRNFKGADLLIGFRNTNLYTLSIVDMMRSSPICLLSKASKTKSWKSKKHTHKPKSEDTIQEKLRIESINGMKYILVIVDDYSRKPDLKYLHVFGALCYPTNDSEDLAKLKPKADIGIFIGYAPAKKAYRIYNRRTRLIMEKIHVNFNELTAMASEQFGLGPTLHEMTPGTISSGLVQNPRSLTPPVPPTKNDWDLLFQPMFNEYFTPPSSVVSRRLPPIIPQAGNTTGTPLSTFVEQDAPAASTSSTTQETQSPVIHDGVEE